MNESKWTPKLVAARLEEAAEVMKRLPMSSPRQCQSSWPPIVQQFWEAYGWNDAEVRLGPPLPDAISRMDEALQWLRWLDQEETKLVWLRAERVQWKVLMRRFGGCRTTIWSRWTSALLQISTRLKSQEGENV